MITPNLSMSSEYASTLCNLNSNLGLEDEVSQPVSIELVFRHCFEIYGVKILHLILCFFYTMMLNYIIHELFR